MSNRDNREVLEGGWLLSGSEPHGQSVRFVFGETELSRAYLGLTVGRHPALCERVLADDSVSRRHFRIGVTGGKLFVEDLNSLNGTFLDDRELAPFQPAPLLPGQEIQAGRVSLTVARLADR
ncbi:MAG: FHA domain-containing protein [Rhodospirillales bacterium]|nr:FHA domain-containing protein [Rhodospirillales bacterium]